MDTRARSIAKAVSYRLLGSACTAAFCFAVSGNAALSMGAGAADMVVKLALYFIHERVWNHIDFGRSKAPEYEI